MPQKKKKLDKDLSTMFFQQLALSPSSKPFSIVFSCPNPLLQGPKSSRHTKNILSHVFCFYPSSPQGWVSSTFDSLKKNNISGWTHLLLFGKGCVRQEVKEQLPVVGNLLCDVEPAFAICTTPCLAGFFVYAWGQVKKQLVTFPFCCSWDLLKHGGSRVMQLNY